MENPSLIFDWESSDSALLFNPSYTIEDKKRYEQILGAAVDWPGHLWLATSGTLAAKWVGLAKPAILASALAVNEHLDSSSNDKWVHVLPDFHVGGVGIWARAFLSGAEVLNYKNDHPGKWDSHLFVEYVFQKKGTLTALVPAQLYDIVQAKLPSPPNLRAVIIGGGRLNNELYRQAVALGWKVLPSYGMTECASQIATAQMESWLKEEFPRLKILPHLEVNEIEECLAFKGESTISLYALVKDTTIELYDPKKEGWFVSQDRGSIKDGYLTVLGRTDSLIKVGGENVDFDRLESLLQTLRLQMGIQQEMTLVSFPDERLGFVIHLATVACPEDVLQTLVNQYNRSVLPFEKIRQLHHVTHLPKNHLSKILRNDLLKLLKD